MREEDEEQDKERDKGYIPMDATGDTAAGHAPPETPLQNGKARRSSRPTSHAPDF